MAEERRWDAELWAMADLVTPMAIRVAATLRIADHISQGSRTAPELAAAAGADTGALDRILRHLAGVGVVDRDDAGRYTLAARGEALRGDDPGGLRGRLDLDGELGRADLALAQLLHSVRTGEPGFPLVFGRSFWDDLAADPKRSARYDEQMGVDVTAWAPAVLAAYDWGSLGHVVDVGGGNGALLIALLREHPRLRGTVLDQPGPTAAAREALAAAGLADRADVVASSFFDPLPPGAGGYLLSAVTHNWDDAAASRILRRCQEAAGPGGKVFVVEKTGAAGATPSTAMDLRMLAYLGGRERGVADLTALAAHAGLAVAAVHTTGSISVLELTAA